eukprot:CAMPEP_0196788534 /NCGR_PEP_ID=MMETSP1104-20130614/25121_1 /TAXON_ID=33652 /ORGANISM="Cafeteria sp., Strain Caron Lab Isolate" /LENGTH=44 /DNA_ID= /DNA_START= /DNA_END= /DNA_ORIENTATION=
MTLPCSVTSAAPYLSIPPDPGAPLAPYLSLLGVPTAPLPSTELR